MELFLNLAGALVATGLICLWLWTSQRGCNRGFGRSTQLVALALLILILFPVISVTDDLIAVQNPAETDSLQRRNLEVFALHTAILSAAIPLEVFRTIPSVETWSGTAARRSDPPLPVVPALASIENRPPPASESRRSLRSLGLDILGLNIA